MTKRTVVSPAGEEIEIVSNDDWLAITGVPKQSVTLWAPRRPILGALWTHGQFTSKSGGASIRLVNHARALGYTAGKHDASVSRTLSGMLRSRPVSPAVYRDINGKRCYKVKLIALPQVWYERLNAEWPRRNGDAPTPAIEPTTAEPLPIAEALPALPPSEPIYDDAPPSVDLAIASSVAMAMLTQVVEIISAGSPAESDRRVKQLKDDFDTVAEKLARRLTENDAMRKSIRELGDEIIALRSERDGLRKRLHMTEANLERATNADATRIINARVQDEIAKVMRTTPTTRKGPDES